MRSTLEDKALRFIEVACVFASHSPFLPGFVPNPVLDIFKAASWSLSGNQIRIATKKYEFIFPNREQRCTVWHYPTNLEKLRTIILSEQPHDSSIKDFGWYTNMNTNLSFCIHVYGSYLFAAFVKSNAKSSG